MMQPMAGPCDSPNVVTVNNLPNVLPDMGSEKWWSERPFYQRAGGWQQLPGGDPATCEHSQARILPGVHRRQRLAPGKFQKSHIFPHGNEY
jgi:hypothetical protein